MNIQQVKQDLEANVIVSRATHLKLAEAAYIMEQTLRELHNYEHAEGSEGIIIGETLKRVKEL